jgi:hypothetical protein
VGIIQTLSNVYRGSFSRGKAHGREADHPSLSRAIVRMVDLYIHSPIRLLGVVLNNLSTGTTISPVFTARAARLMPSYFSRGLFNDVTILRLPSAHPFSISAQLVYPSEGTEMSALYTGKWII